MVGLADKDWGIGGARIMAALLLAGTLLACTASPPAEPPPAAAVAPPAPPPPSPPPIDLSGKWHLTAAGGTSCLMTFGDAPGAGQGSIAPAGGCPGNFFTSRKWTYEQGALVIHDHKGETLAQLSFAIDHFEGQGPNGTALTLSR
jgi:hypothetical protein